MNFKKGDVAMLINCKKYPDLSGEAVIIASGLELRLNDSGFAAYGYKLTLKCDDIARFAEQHQLCKAPLPRQADRLTKMKWSDGPWQPYSRPDCMALARELQAVRNRTAALRRRLK